MESRIQVHALLPLVTYPDPNSEAIAANAVAISSVLGVELHALAINADVPDISNVVSKVLLDYDAMASRAEALSRQSGERLLALVEEEAARAGVGATTETITARIAFLGEEAAPEHATTTMSCVAGRRETRRVPQQQ